MPEGSEAFEESYIMMIPQPMNWQDAVFFAQNYGAHLYVPKTDESLEKISSKLTSLGDPYTAGVWLGAAKAGRNTWGTVLGQSWSLSKKPIGVSPFVAVDADNILRTKKHDDRLPFIIQWDLDGKNTGSFFAMLRRTAQSVKGGGQPEYPPGCMVYDNKPVLLIAHRCTVGEAKAFAKSFGGHLVALSDKDKNTWLLDQLKDFSTDAAYWIGAERKGSGWKWPNGDKWAAEGWSAGEPGVDGSSVIIRPGGGWQATHGNQQATGFIIEWSPLPEEDTSAPKDETAYVDLKGKAQQLLKELDVKREAQLKENAATFEGDLDKWLKGLKKTEENLWSPEIRAMKELVKDSRLSNRKPEDEGIRMGGGMKKAYEVAKARQEAIDADFASKAITIQKSYIKHLEDQKAKYEKDGDGQKVAIIQTELEDSEDVDDWITKMGFISGADDE
jgi:Lectin C-type domain